jgi:Mn-dependent DtxR family transcriptional regulator
MGSLLYRYSAATPTSGAIANNIVDVLKEYKQELPIGFVAKVLGQDRKTINSYLEELKDQNIVVIIGDSKVALKQYASV